MGAGSVAFPIVGNALQAWAAFREQAGMNAAIQNYLGSERDYSTQAQQQVDQSIAQSGVDTANRQIATGTERANRNYAQAEASGQGTQSNAIVGQSNPQANQAWASLMGAARAPLQGYNEFTLQQMIKNLHTSQQLGVISQLANLRAGVLPFELRKQQNSWQELAEWGKIIGSLGGLTGSTSPDSSGGSGNAAAGAAALAAL